MQEIIDSEYGIRKCYLMMGWACNFHCRHCYQSDSKKENIKKTINPKVFEYLKRLQYIQNRPISIVFWGGEPLLYFDIIKKTIGELGPDFDYSLISNGSLLTKEHVDFFNKNSVLFSVSNDGKFTDKVRDYNVLEDENFIKLFKQIKKKCVGVSTNAHTQNPQDLQKYIYSKVGPIAIYYQYILHCNWEMPKDLYDFDIEKMKDQYQKTSDLFIEDVIKGNVYSANVSCLIKGVRQFMNYTERGNKSLWYPECAVMRRTICLDLQGNFYACNNNDTKIGTLDDDYYTLLDRYDCLIKSLNEKNKEKGCDNCSVNYLCRRGCPFLEPSKGQKRCCEVEKIYWSTCADTVRKAAKITTEIKL